DPGRPGDHDVVTEAGNQEALDARAHDLYPAELARLRQEIGRKAPGVEDLRLRHVPGRGLGRLTHGQAEQSARCANQRRVGIGLVRVIDENEAGGAHAPSLARSRSSNVKSTARSAKPCARYQSMVCRIAPASV